MWNISKTFVVAFFALLVCSIAVAHTDGIYNPKANSIGNFEGIDSNAATGAAPVFSLTFNATAQTANTTLTTVDFGTVAYSSGNTRVIVGLLWFGNVTVTGVTVGGVSLAQISGAKANNSGPNSDIWQSSAPLAGSSGDVQVTYSGTLSFNSSIALYSLVTSTPVAAAANGAVAPSGTVVSAAITVPAGGGGLAITWSGNGATMSFTNAAVDADITPGGNHHFYGHTTSTGAITVTATYATSNVLVLSTAAWAP